MNFESIIDDAINNNKAMQGSFSGPITKDGSKIKFKTILMKGEEHLQIEKFIPKNLMIRAFKDKVNPLAEAEYEKIKNLFGLENIFIEG